MQKALELLAFSIEILAIGIMVWGILVAVYGLLRIELKRGDSTPSQQRIRFVRVTFGGYLLLALEFMIAADIVYTVFHREIEDIIILVSIVTIRIAMSYFLNRELNEEIRLQRASTTN